MLWSSLHELNFVWCFPSFWFKFSFTLLDSTQSFVMKFAALKVWIAITVCSLIFISNLFGSVVAVAFQSAFRAEMYQNDVFPYFKNHY